MGQVRITRAGSEAAPGNEGGETLRIIELHVTFNRGTSPVHAVRGLTLALDRGRIVGVAGESGSGKSASALAVMGLHPRGTTVTGSIEYQGRELVGIPEKELRRLRGREIAMVFQETGTALNPLLRVGDQLTLAVKAHTSLGKAQMRERVRQALTDVRLSDPDRVLRAYPHELSGGMAQRIVIAMALSCGSKVLLADEPTTALDVSVQKEILDLLRGLVAERDLAVMMISHDLAVLAEVCDELVVMYRGECVETGHARDVLRAPAHPYTRALLDCLPTLRSDHSTTLPEMPPPTRLADAEQGCRFRDRCAWRIDRCELHPSLEPVGSDAGRRARCWRADELWALDGPVTRDAHRG